MKLLGELQPKSSYMRLFKEIVIDVWKVELAQAAEVRRLLERKLALVSEKKNRLVSAFLYENKIDKSTYEEQLDRLREDAALAEMELHEAKLDEFDVEGILEFANHVLTELSRFWMQSDVRSKDQVAKSIVSKWPLV